MHTKNIHHLCSRIPTSVWAFLHTRAFTRTRGHARIRARVGMSLFGLLLGVTLLTPAAATAATQGYNTQDKTITKGMAVAVSNTTTADAKVIYVEKASVDHADKTLGVVVDPSSETVAVSTNGDQVYVATTGVASVYVTDLNGTVHKGDLLTPSPLNGILMRAGDGSKGVLGVAQSDFDSKTAQSVSLKEEVGSTKAKVGLVQINMDVKFTTNSPNAGKTLLQRLGEAIVHHEVSTVQVVIALIILTLLIVVEGGIVYGAVSSSITSLGRNPLAKNTIMTGLGEVTGLVAAVLALGVAAVYLVLWV